MKVLVLASRYPTDYDKVRGSFYREQALAMRARGIDVRVLSVMGYSIKEIIKHRRLLKKRYEYCDTTMVTTVRTVLNVPKLRRINYLLRALLGMHEYKRLSRNWIPDIIHVQSYQAGEIASKIKLVYNIPYTITEHSTLFFESPKETELNISRMAFQNAEKRWAVSPALADKLKALFGLDVSVLPNSVNTDVFRPMEKFKELDTPFVFIVVGYLTPQKRIPELILAFHKARSICSAVLQLHIVGDGPERNRVENLISSLGEQDSITIFGELSRTEVARRIAGSNCLVVSSMVETFGVTVIEALSCGIPVISTRCGGPEYILADAPYCALVDDAEEALAEKLSEFAERGSVDGDVIRQFAVQRYSAESVADRYIQEFNHVLESGRRRRHPCCQTAQE